MFVSRFEYLISDHLQLRKIVRTFGQLHSAIRLGLVLLSMNVKLITMQLVKMNVPSCSFLMFELVGPQLTKCLVSFSFSVVNPNLLNSSVRACKFEAAIDHFVATNRELRPYELSSLDWINIKRITEWLAIFRAATTQMSATKVPMLSTTHFIFRGLQEELKKILRELPDNVSSGIKAGILKAHWKLSDYFYKFDESPYPTWASRMLSVMFSFYETNFYLQFSTHALLMMTWQLIIPMRLNFLRA